MSKIIKKDFEKWEIAYGKIYAENQKIRNIFTDNKMKREANLTEKYMSMLNVIYHKSKYPEKYGYLK